MRRADDLGYPGSLLLYRTLYRYKRCSDPLIYNEEKLTAPKGNVAKQIIEYDPIMEATRPSVSTPLLMRSTTHNMGRDVGEVKALLEEYDSLEKAL